MVTIDYVPEQLYVRVATLDEGARPGHTPHAESHI